MRSVYLVFVIVLVVATMSSTFYMPAVHADQYRLELNIDEAAVYQLLGMENQKDGLIVEYATLTIPGAGILLPEHIENDHGSIHLSFTYKGTLYTNNTAYNSVDVYPAAVLVLADYNVGARVALILRSSTILASHNIEGQIDAKTVVSKVRDALEILHRNPFAVFNDPIVNVDGKLLAILNYRDDVFFDDMRDDWKLYPQNNTTVSSLVWFNICSGPVTVDQALDPSSPDYNASTPPAWWSNRVITNDPQKVKKTWDDFRDDLLVGIYRIHKGSDLNTAMRCIARHIFNDDKGDSYSYYPDVMVSVATLDTFMEARSSSSSWATWEDYKDTHDTLLLGFVPLLNYSVINLIDSADSESFLDIEVSLFLYSYTTGVSGFTFAGFPVSVHEWESSYLVSYSESADLNDHKWYYYLPAGAEVDSDVIIVKWVFTGEDSSYYYLRPIPLVTPLYSTFLIPLDDFLVGDTFDPGDLVFYNGSRLPSTTNFTVDKNDYPGNNVNMLYMNITNVNQEVDYEIVSIGTPILMLIPDLIGSGPNVPGHIVKYAAKILSETMYLKFSSNGEVMQITFRLVTSHRPSGGPYLVIVENLVPPLVLQETSGFVDWMHWTGIKIEVHKATGGGGPGCGPTYCPTDTTG